MFCLIKRSHSPIISFFITHLTTHNIFFKTQKPAGTSWQQKTQKNNIRKPLAPSGSTSPKSWRILTPQNAPPGIFWQCSNRLLARFGTQQIGSFAHQIPPPIAPNPNPIRNSSKKTASFSNTPLIMAMRRQPTKPSSAP
jgi:hypothetical protein